MEEVFSKIWFVLFLPLAGAIFQALFGGMIVRAMGPAKGKRMMGAIAVIPVALAFCAGVGFTWQLCQFPPESRSAVMTLFDWITIHGLNVPFEVVIDPLSLTMVLVITGVGSLIHLYATGYMAEEVDYTRFFTYLNLFISAMLILVLGNNLPLMFIGWEGVGLCSYLLIAFWYKDIYNAKCGNKAFIVNRIGDWGLTLGIFLLMCVMASYFANSPTGSDGRWLSYDVFLPAIPLALKAQPAVATAIALLLFVGACGKSAQFPLYFWLPDAMAGPTPVSALIHAATMVTAGVFMLTRLQVIFALSPLAMGIVAVVGAFTALFAALVAFGQTDIKKVLAYSTVSQLGFMFVACGVGAFWAGMFHVVTHAFFKALLFLGSGAVIAAMSHDQDMRQYGNLIRYIKITGFAMIIGWLAIAGIMPLSGFFSKEAIVGAALAPNTASFFGWNISPVLGWVLLGVALLTAAYMTRLMMLTFFSGEERWRELAAESSHEHEDHEAHPALSTHPAHSNEHHEDPHGFFMTDEEAEARADHEHHHGLTPDHTPKEVYPSMWIPLVILAALSAVAGWILNPAFRTWLFPETAILSEEHSLHFPTHAQLIWISSGVAVAGILYGWIVYRRGLPKSEREEASWSPFRRAAGAQFGYDGIVMEAGVEGGGTIANWLWRKIDMVVIDGFYNSVGWLTAQFGYILRLFQSGFVRSYALIMLVGGVALLSSFWYAIAHLGDPK